MAGGSEGFVFSLVINAITIIAAVTAFLILRKRFPKVYEPRHCIDSSSIEPIGPGIINWFKAVWQLPNETVLERVGLDGYMLMHFLELGTRFFAILAVIGCAVLIPVNYNGGNWGKYDDKDGELVARVSDKFDRLSMANVETRSDMLWFHVVIVWLFSVLAYYYLYHSLQHYAEARHSFLSRITPQSYTVIAYDLPADMLSDIKVRDFFDICYPGKVQCITLFRDCLHLTRLFEQRKLAISNLEHAKAVLVETGKRPEHIPSQAVAGVEVCCACCVCRDKVDSLTHYARVANELTDKLAYERKQNLRILPAAAITFNSLSATTSAAQVKHQSAFKSLLKCVPSCEPKSIFWPNIGMPKKTRQARRLLVGAAVFGLVFWFMVPIAFIQSLTTIESLSKRASWLSWAVSDNAIVKGFFETYLPTLILLVFMALLPMICLELSKQEGTWTIPGLEAGQMYKLFYFFLFNTFLTSTISGSVFESLDQLIASPTSIVKLFGQSLPKLATFFISFVMLAVSVFAMELLRLVPLIVTTAKLRFLAKTDAENKEAYNPGPVPYGILFSGLIGMFMISLTYAVIHPLILPFAFCYFGLGWFVWKHQITWVYVPQYESGSLIWPSVYNRLVASVLVFQITMLGLFGLKESYAQSPFILPLPFITGYFFYLSSGNFIKDTRYLPLEVAALQDRKNERDHKEGMDFKSMEKAYVQEELKTKLAYVEAEPFGAEPYKDEKTEKETEGLLHSYRGEKRGSLGKVGGSSNRASRELEKVPLQDMADNKV